MEYNLNDILKAVPSRTVSPIEKQRIEYDHMTCHVTCQMIGQRLKCLIKPTDHSASCSTAVDTNALTHSPPFWGETSIHIIMYCMQPVCIYTRYIATCNSDQFYL